jgi:hypothetical protein
MLKTGASAHKSASGMAEGAYDAPFAAFPSSAAKLPVTFEPFVASALPGVAVAESGTQEDQSSTEDVCMSREELEEMKYYAPLISLPSKPASARGDFTVSETLFCAPGSSINDAQATGAVEEPEILVSTKPMSRFDPETRSASIRASAGQVLDLKGDKLTIEASKASDSVNVLLPIARKFASPAGSAVEFALSKEAEKLGASVVHASQTATDTVKGVDQTMDGRTTASGEGVVHSTVTSETIGRSEMALAGEMQDTLTLRTPARSRKTSLFSHLQLLEASCISLAGNEKAVKRASGCDESGMTEFWKHVERIRASHPDLQRELRYVGNGGLGRAAPPFFKAPRGCDEPKLTFEASNVPFLRSLALANGLHTPAFDSRILGLPSGFYIPNFTAIIFALISAIIRTCGVSYLGHPLVGERAPYRLWDREGIGTGRWRV